MFDKLLISMVADEAGEEVHLHLNATGIDTLIGYLDGLKQSLVENKVEHVHLAVEEWADDELTVGMVDSEARENWKQIKQLSIYAWTLEWQEKHGL